MRTVHGFVWLMAHDALPRLPIVYQPLGALLLCDLGRRTVLGPAPLRRARDAHGGDAQHLDAACAGRGVHAVRACTPPRNCASSVEPASADSDDDPPAITWLTWSK